MTFKPFSWSVPLIQRLKRPRKQFKRPYRNTDHVVKKLGVSKGYLRARHRQNNDWHHTKETAVARWISRSTVVGNRFGMSLFAKWQSTFSTIEQRVANDRCPATWVQNTFITPINCRVLCRRCSDLQRRVWYLQKFQSIWGATGAPTRMGYCYQVRISDWKEDSAICSLQRREIHEQSVPKDATKGMEVRC